MPNKKLSLKIKTSFAVLIFYLAGSSFAADMTPEQKPLYDISGPKGLHLVHNHPDGGKHHYIYNL